MSESRTGDFEGIRLEYIDPFVRAGFSVLETLLKARPGRGPLAMRSSTFTTQQLTLLMRVTGDAEGAVLYGMSLVAAQKIASAMLEEPIAEMDDKAWGAVTELGNVINKRAADLLAEAGCNCEISQPEVMRGVNTTVETDVPALVVPISTRFGRLEINVALTIANKAGKAA